MGWVYCTSPCLRCGRIFSYNPHRVPSSSAVTGKREPICRSCIDAINVKRRELGFEPFEIPHDAYDAIPEEEF